MLGGIPRASIFQSRLFWLAEENISMATDAIFSFSYRKKPKKAFEKAIMQLAVMVKVSGRSN